jgi:hypothetical protein
VVYPLKVKENILPLSISGTLPEAFNEWYFTDNTIDHEAPIEVCQLCNQEQLRYHFEIKNSYTNYTLMVGSQCILKFQLQVLENGRLLNEVETKKKLDYLIKKMRQESCIKALDRLAEAEDSDILSNARAYYKNNKYLTPKQAFVVFWRLNVNEIDYSPSFFKVSLKKDKYKNDLRLMQENRVQLIWPALTYSQRRIAERYGHRAN